MELSKQDIDVLPTIKREAEIKSRNLFGYHAFRMHFIQDFLKLPLGAQADHLRSVLGDGGLSWGVASGADDDSTDTVCPSSRDIRRLVSRWWSVKLTDDIKEAWEDRAKKLNSRPVPGKFYRLARGLQPQLEEMVKRNLEVEWAMMRGILRTCLLKEVKDITVARSMTLAKAATFGRERVTVGDLSLRTHPMSPLLRFSLFGTGESNLLGREVVYSSNEVMVVHLASLRRVQKIFTIGGVAGLETELGDGTRKVACGRVSLVRNGRHVTGFVIDEMRNQLKVRLETGEEIELLRPKYVETAIEGSSGRKRGAYELGRAGKGKSNLKVVAYWPVRVSVSKKGRARFMFARAAIKPDGKVARSM